MVQPLCAGVRLTAIFDSCHSGTALDLPYIYSTQGILKEPNLAKEAGQGLLGVISSYSQGDLGGMGSQLVSLFKKATSGEEAHSRAIATKTSPADVVMWSGSKDDQTSYVSQTLICPAMLTVSKVPIPPLAFKPLVPCLGPLSLLSRRTPSRATSSFSTASVTSSLRDIRRSPSCPAATPLVWHFQDPISSIKKLTSSYRYRPSFRHVNSP